MKKIVLTMMAVGMIAVAGATGNETVVSTEVSAPVGGSLKLINDTDGEVSIHTGTGFVTLNKGGSTSITCEEGKEIRMADKGKKGDVIFTVESSMCGKTIKLSAYM
jgi:hypothetical protein